jgi:HSP20 family protein
LQHAEQRRNMRDQFFAQYGFHLSAATAPHPHGAWAPAVDVYRCCGGWLLKFELAGVRQEDIQVQLDSQGVTVAGTRLDRRPYELQEAHLIEIAYSRFERFVPLPEAIENVQFQIEFHEGMMYVRVLRSDDAQR